jgi:hypothetical protein
MNHTKPYRQRAKTRTRQNFGIAVVDISHLCSCVRSFDGQTLSDMATSLRKRNTRLAYGDFVVTEYVLHFGAVPQIVDGELAAQHVAYAGTGGGGGFDHESVETCRVPFTDLDLSWRRRGERLVAQSIHHLHAENRICV